MENIRRLEVVTEWQDRGINLPQQATKTSAGYDIESAIDVVIQEGEKVVVPTGIKAYFYEDEVLYLHIRSSLAIKLGMDLINNVGVIDSDYYNNEKNEGHILVALENDGDTPVYIKKGDRIAQLVLHKYLTFGNVEPKDNIRSGGVGSTNENN